MKKSVFAAVFSLCAASFCSMPDAAFAQDGSDEILPPIVFIILDTSASMNESFPGGTNNTRLTNALAEIIGGSTNYSDDGKLIRAQGDKEADAFNMPFPVLAENGDWTESEKTISGDSQIAKPNASSRASIDLSYNESGIIHTYKKLVKFGFSGLAVGSAGSSSVKDSKIKQAAGLSGGQTDNTKLRFTLVWGHNANDEESSSDLDSHVVINNSWWTSGKHIYYRDSKSDNGGLLDVDNITPSAKSPSVKNKDDDKEDSDYAVCINAKTQAFAKCNSLDKEKNELGKAIGVENIYWRDVTNIDNGTLFEYYVQPYSYTTKTHGFQLEVSYTNQEGCIVSDTFTYNGVVTEGCGNRESCRYPVVTLKYIKDGESDGYFEIAKDANGNELIGYDSGKSLSDETWSYEKDFRTKGKPLHIYGYAASMTTNNGIRYGLNLEDLEYKRNIDCTYDKGIWSMQKEADAPLAYPTASDKERDITDNNERIIQIARTYMGTAATPLGEALADVYYMFGGDSAKGTDEGLLKYKNDNGEVAEDSKFYCKGRHKSVILITDGDPNGSGIQDPKTEGGGDATKHGHSTEIWHDTAHLYKDLEMKTFVIGYSGEFDTSQKSFNPADRNSAAYRLSKAAWRGGTCYDASGNLIDPSDAGETDFENFIDNYNTHKKLCFYSAVTADSLRTAIVNAISDSLGGTVSKTPAVTTTAIGFKTAQTDGKYHNGFSNIYSGYNVLLGVGNNRNSLLERSMYICDPDKGEFIEKEGSVSFATDLSKRLDCDIRACAFGTGDRNATGKPQPATACATAETNTCRDKRVIFAGDYSARRDKIYPGNAKLHDGKTDTHKADSASVSYNVKFGAVKYGNGESDYHFLTESSAGACREALEFNPTVSTEDARRENYLLSPFECFSDPDCGIDSTGQKMYFCVSGRCAERTQLGNVKGTRPCERHRSYTEGADTYAGCNEGEVCHHNAADNSNTCLPGVILACDIRQYIASQRLGTIEYATPVVVEPPSKAYKNASYKLFQKKYWDRDTMLLVGANDGMLHSFIIGKNNDADYTPESDLYSLSSDIVPGGSASSPFNRAYEEGDELWGFVPKAILPKIREVSKSGMPSNVNAAPAVADVRAPQTYYAANEDRSDPTKADSPLIQWRTVAVGGFRDGARGYYALDITNPAKPKILWEIDPTFQFEDDSATAVSGEASNPSSSDMAQPDDKTKTTADYIIDANDMSKTDADYFPFSLLGKTYAQPIVTNVLINGIIEPVAVLSGGLNSNSDENSLVGHALYIVRLFPQKSKDLLVKTFYFENEITGAPSIYPNTFNATAQHVYFGDNKGAVYRLSLTGDIANWGSQDKKNIGTSALKYEVPVFDPSKITATGNKVFEEITHKPAVALHHMAGNRPVIQIAIGTGSNDNLNIKDNDPNYVGIFYDVPTSDGHYAFNGKDALTTPKLIVFNTEADANSTVTLTDNDRQYDKEQSFLLAPRDPATVTEADNPGSATDKFDSRQKMTGSPIIYNFDTYFPTYISTDSKQSESVCSYGRAAIYAIRDNGTGNGSANYKHGSLKSDNAQNSEQATDPGLVKFMDGKVSVYRLDSGTKIYGLQITNQLYCGNGKNGKFAVPQLVAQTGIANGVNGFDKENANNFASSNVSLNTFGVNLRGIQAASRRVKWASVYE